jgi:hypothetical protein
MRKQELISIISLGERMLQGGSKLPTNFVLSLEKFRLELKGLE